MSRGGEWNRDGWVSFAAVKAGVSLREVLEDYLVMEQLRRSGASEQYRGGCPIHGGQGLAFHAHLDKNAFHCFACGAGGNVLDFVAAMERCSIARAAQRLQDRFLDGVELETAPGRYQERARKETGCKKRKGNAALGFTLSGVDPSHSYVRQRGLRLETAARFGVGYYAGPGIMSGRVVIPIHDEQGRLVGYGGRAVNGEEPRYRFPAGFQKSEVLFNYHRVAELEAKRVVVVEGFFDCMQVHQAGCASVVALLGVALSETQEKLLANRFAEVMLLLDGDTAGQAARRNIAARLAGQCAVRQVLLPEGIQPDQMSGEDIRAAIAQCTNGE